MFYHLLSQKFIQDTIDIMDPVLPPRESGKFISDKSRHVRVVKNEIGKAAEILIARMSEVKYSEKTWKTHELHPKQITEDTIDWIFVVDCLNFSFWVKKEQEPFKVEYHGKLYSDYEALCAVVNRALEVIFKCTIYLYLISVSKHSLK